MTIEKIIEEIKYRMGNVAANQEVIDGLKDHVGIMDVPSSDRELLTVLVNDYERITRELSDHMNYLDQLGDVDTNLQMISLNSILRHVEREWEGSKRYHSPTSLIMFGIDQIDDISDPRQRQATYKELGAIIDTSTRMTDTFGRLDDEHFLIIVPTTNNFQAAWLSGKLRETIEGYTFESGRRLTASFGVADSGASMDHKDWLAITKEAFQKARKNGGNQVVDYEADIEK